MTPRLAAAALATSLIAASAGLAAGPEFQIVSESFREGAPLSQDQILNGFGCSGANLSPAIAWENPPEGAKSFAITLYDPDAPTGSGWWHWVVFNLPAETRALAEGAGDPASALTPVGAVQSRTDFGAPGYGGPCPPEGAGDHRYVLRVHALDVESLPLDETASAAMVGFFLGQTSLGVAETVVRHGR